MQPAAGAGRPPFAAQAAVCGIGLHLPPTGRSGLREPAGKGGKGLSLLAPSALLTLPLPLLLPCRNRAKRLGVRQSSAALHWPCPIPKRQRTGAVQKADTQVQPPAAISGINRWAQRWRALGLERQRPPSAAGASRPPFPAQAAVSCMGPKSLWAAREHKERKGNAMRGATRGATRGVSPLARCRNRARRLGVRQSSAALRWPCPMSKRQRTGAVQNADAHVRPPAAISGINRWAQRWRALGPERRRPPPAAGAGRPPFPPQAALNRQGFQPSECRKRTQGTQRKRALATGIRNRWATVRSVTYSSLNTALDFSVLRSMRSFAAFSCCALIPQRTTRI